MDLAHQKSEMGIRFDNKKSISMESIYARFKSKLEKEFGPQKMEGVCLDFQNKKPNSPVYI